LGVLAALCLVGTGWTAYQLYRTESNSGLGASDPRWVSRLAQARLGVAVALLGLGLVSFEIWRKDLVFRHEAQRGALVAEHEKKLAHFEELAASLAHEVRNPLTAISALVYSLQRKFEVHSKEFRDAALIRSEISRVDGMLKEYTQLARPLAPKPSLTPGDLLLKDIARLLRPRLEKDKVTLECRCDESTMLYADREQLTQVLLNLVQNAAESMKGGGRVTVRATQATRPIDGPPQSVTVIEVQDEGSGIPEDVKNRIFEPFFSTKREGTGLGLPVSSRIIRRHQGSLEFESKPGKGTVFRVVLPAHERRN
jgi:two-component system sporulation sensor kinase A